MSRKPTPPGPPTPAHAGTPTVQRSRSFDAVIKSHAQRGRGAHVDELVTGGGGLFQARDPDRNVMSRPTGIYNFVRVEGQTRNQAATYISARAPHATLAQGRPVLYAGTAAFNGGQLDWWSNYSGTYQPIAEFNRQASLPTDKFVPWQKLQMGGVGLQRGMLSDHRGSMLPEKTAEKPKPESAALSKEPAKTAPPVKSAEPAKPTTPAKPMGTKPTGPVRPGGAGNP